MDHSFADCGPNGARESRKENVSQMADSLLPAKRTSARWIQLLILCCTAVGSVLHVGHGPLVRGVRGAALAAQVDGEPQADAGADAGRCALLLLLYYSQAFFFFITLNFFFFITLKPRVE